MPDETKGPQQKNGNIWMKHHMTSVLKTTKKWNFFKYENNSKHWNSTNTTNWSIAVKYTTFSTSQNFLGKTGNCTVNTLNTLNDPHYPKAKIHPTSPPKSRNSLDWLWLVVTRSFCVTNTRPSRLTLLLEANLTSHPRCCSCQVCTICARFTPAVVALSDTLSHLLTSPPLTWLVSEKSASHCCCSFRLVVVFRCFFFFFLPPCDARE